MISRHTPKSIVQSILLAAKVSRIFAFFVLVAIVGFSFAIPQSKATVDTYFKSTSYNERDYTFVVRRVTTGIETTRVNLIVPSTSDNGNSTFSWILGTSENDSRGVLASRGQHVELGSNGQTFAGTLAGFSTLVVEAGTGVTADSILSCYQAETQQCPALNADRDFRRLPAEITLSINKNKFPSIPAGQTSVTKNYALVSVMAVNLDQADAAGNDRALLISVPDQSSLRPFRINWIVSDTADMVSRSEPIANRGPNEVTPVLRASSGAEDINNSNVPIFADPKATWRSTYNYKFHPSANQIALDIGTIEWRGVAEGEDQSTDRQIRRGDKILIDGEERRVSGFSYGLAPVGQNKADWNCDGAGGDNICSGLIARSSASEDNPSGHDPDLLVIDTSKFGSNLAGTQQYKVVPILELGISIAGTVFNSRAGLSPRPPYVVNYTGAEHFITIRWDTTVSQSLGVPNSTASTNPSYQAYAAATRDGQSQVIATESATDTNESAGKSLADGLQATIAIVVNIILTIIATIVHGLVWLVMQLVVVALTALLGGVDFFKAANIPDFVKVGWVYVRDLMNSFFIIALIATGVMMMINKGSYRLVNIIRDLIYVAIIINFSLLLGQLVLGLAQVLINTFIDPDLIKNLVLNVKVGAAATFFNTVENEGYLAAAGNLTGFSYTAQLIFTIFFEITMVIVLGMLAALLVVRLVTVWLMLIISPVPYMMDTFFSSVGKKAGKDASMITVSGWWKKFIDNAIFAPVMGFFIILALKLATSPAFSGLSGVAGWTPLYVETIKGIFIFGILMKGMEISKSFSIEYSDKIISKAENWRKSAINKGAFTFLPRGIGGIADSAGRAIERKGGALKGPIGRGLVKGLGKGISRSGIYGFKKLPLYPEIASGVAKKMAKKVGDDISREKGLDSTNWTSRLARGFADSGTKKEDRSYASKGFGAAMQYLGATEEDRATELQSQGEVFRKKYKGLDAPELKRIFDEASSEAEKRGAFMAMLDNRDLPLDLEEARAMAEVAKTKLAVDKDDIYNRRPDLLAEPMKDAAGNIMKDSAGRIVYDESKVVDRLMTMTPDQRISMHDEAAENSEVARQWMHADLIRKHLNTNLDQMAQETTVLKNKIAEAKKKHDDENDANKKAALKIAWDARQRHLDTHMIAIANRENEVRSRADIEYSKMKKPTLTREISRLKAIIKREYDFLPDPLKPKAKDISALEARIKLDVAEKI